MAEARHSTDAGTELLFSILHQAVAACDSHSIHRTVHRIQKTCRSAVEWKFDVIAETIRLGAGWPGQKGWVAKRQDAPSSAIDQSWTVFEFSRADDETSCACGTRPQVVGPPFDQL